MPMTHEPDHPLLHMLRGVKAATAEIQKWSAAWAEASLVPILRDIHDAMSRADLTGPDILRYVRPLQELLKKRPETEAIAVLPEHFHEPDVRAVDDRGPLPQVVTLDKRIPNEIRREAAQLVEQFRAAPPTPPAKEAK